MKENNKYLGIHLFIYFTSCKWNYVQFEDDYDT